MSPASMIPALLFALSCNGEPEDTGPATDTSPADTAAPEAGCVDELPPIAFTADAPDSTTMYEIAADFTVDTTDGPWTLSEHWTGCDNVLIIQDYPDQAPLNYWPKGLWDRDVKKFFEALPANTYVLFVSVQGNQSKEESIANIQDRVADNLGELGQEAIDHWTPRVRFLTDKASKLDGWLGDIMKDPGWGVGIDRFQKVRYVGSYADYNRYESDYGWFAPNLKMVANEAAYYNFERNRQYEMDQHEALTVPLYSGEVVSGWLETTVEVPDAATLAQYDTLEIDLHMGCDGEGEYGTCPAWDYMAYLYQCTQPVEENAYSDTACQPYVAAVSGTCYVDGIATEDTCTTDEDCAPPEDTGDTAGSDSAPLDSGADSGPKTESERVCVGYEAEIAADTQTCDCVEATGELDQATQTCNDDGAGYGDCPCPCNNEVGRWITTYHREGTWVHDVSQLLPYLGEGGSQRWGFSTTGPYELVGELRLTNRGKADRSSELIYLFDGGTINSDYNANHPPIEVDIPADAARVELVTVITGHGADSNNCAEFCDITHEFAVNGDRYARDFPEAATAQDCMDKVGTEGTVPNQYGTWWYGRAGWCPGKDVPPHSFDITDSVTLGATNTFEYAAWFRGAEYDGWATIRMRSWVAVYR